MNYFLKTISTTVVVGVILASSAVAAQEPAGNGNLPSAGAPMTNLPFSPKKLTPSEVIVSLAYSDSPLTMPFKETSRETVLSGEFPKYKHNLSNGYKEVVDYFENAMRHGQDLPILNTLVAGFSKTPNVRVVGKQVSPQASTFSVAVIGKSYRISFKVTPQKDGTSVVVDGLKSSSVYSGSMPVRSPFRPADAKDIPFRWN